MPPERHFNHEIILEDKDGNVIHLGKADSLFEGIEKSINQELEKEVIEEQKQLKKEKRDEKLKALTSYIMLVNTTIDLYIIAKGIYFGYKELKKRGN